MALVSLSLLSGCWLRVPKETPPSSLPDRFVEADAATYDSDSPAESSVWHAFNDPMLDRLIQTAVARNTTLRQTLAQLNEARALRGLEFYSLVPTVTASASRTRSKPSSRDPFVPPGLGTTTSFKAGFDAVWEIDLFGGAYSARRAARAQESAAQSALQAARLAVVAEVAQSYFSLRAEQSRLRIQQQSLAALDDNQRLLEARLQAGRGTDLDVERARAQLMSTRARLPQTEAAIVRNEQRLAVLTVQPVEQLRTDLGANGRLPGVPALVPVGSPAQWLQRRPDIRAARSRLESATAQTGVAMADFFPQLTLVGGFGWTGQVAGDIGRSAAQRWNYGPSIQWSFLDAGRVRQRVLASKARAAGALAAYDEAVLRALEETENAFAGLRAANQSAAALEQALHSARRATQVARQRFEAGATDSLTVLDAQRSELDIEDQWVSGEASRATSLASVYKALAGDFAAADGNGGTNVR